MQQNTAKMVFIPEKKYENGRSTPSLLSQSPWHTAARLRAAGGVWLVLMSFLDGMGCQDLAQTFARHV
jgi:hypothetical protein